jgi:glutathione S-transferase
VTTNVARSERVRITLFVCLFVCLFIDRLDRYTVQEPGVADAAAVGYARWYFARLRLLNTTLADGRDFLVGGRFTIADICVALALHVGRTLSVRPDTDE